MGQGSVWPVAGARKSRGLTPRFVTGHADLIASGDKRDLLPMGSFRGIPIITAREAVERLEARLKT